MLGSAATFGFDSSLLSVLCRHIVITDEPGANPSFFMSIGTAIRTEPQSSIAMEAFAKARAAPIILMAQRRAEDRRRT